MSTTEARPDSGPALEEAQQSAYPVLAHERTWGRLAFIGVGASLAAGTWLFPIGGAVASFLPAWSGTLVMVGGMMIGMGLLFVGTVPMQNRHGIDSVSGTVPFLGIRGSGLALALVWLSIVAWNVILTIIMGRSFARIMREVGLLNISEGSVNPVGNAIGIVGLALVVVLVVNGPAIIKRLEVALALMVVVIVLLIFGLLFGHFGFKAVGDAKPLAPFGNHHMDFVVVLELLIATGLSWWPWVGGLVRLVPSPRKAMPGFMIGLGLTVPLVTAASLYSALVTQDPDPSSWMLTVGGTGWGVLGLLLVVAANLGTLAANLFVAGVAANRVPVVRERLSWTGNLLITTIPVMVLVILFGDTFLAQTPKVLAFSGLFYAPLAGIGAVDYFVLRRGTISLRGLYDGSRTAPYYYWGGVNPVGVAAAVAGFVTYLALLDPLTLESHGIFKWTTASVPALVVSAIAYLALTRLITKPMGKGDLDRPR